MAKNDVTPQMEEKMVEKPTSPLVSVIIPVYNSEKYLEECLESVINQTLRDIEILCINDGSTDGSLGILQQILKKDSRIRLIDQENLGESCARNAGIEKSSGRYVYFLDSDDILRQDALELLYNRMEEDKLELLCFDAEPFITEELRKETYDKYLHYKAYYKRRHTYPALYSGPELGTAFIENKEFLSQPCLSMMSRDHLERDHLRYYPGILHEDSLFTICNFFTAKRVSYLPEVLYFRRIHENSIMTRNASFRNVYGYLISFFKTNEFLQLQTSLSRREQEAVVARLHVFINMAKKYYGALPEKDKELDDKEFSPQFLMWVRFLVKDPFDYEEALKEKKQKLHEQKEKGNTLESEKKAFQEESTRLKRKCKELEKERDSFFQKCECLEEKRKEAILDYVNTKKQAEEMRTQLEEINAQREEVIAEKEKLLRRIRELEKKNERLRREEAELKGVLGKVRKNFFYRGLRKLRIIREQ
ncbi:MAG: glycosyltransferase [Blautia sp.]|nr:glycosyltransferase [Blautia sp.]